MKCRLAWFAFSAIMILGLCCGVSFATDSGNGSAAAPARVHAEDEVQKSGPKYEIKQTINKIVAQLRTIGSTNAWRDKVTELVRDKFNFEVMSQGVLGPGWHQANAEQRERFIELFAQLLEETYIGRVREYTDQKIRFGNEQIRKNRAMVDTYIAMESGDEIPISYKMLQHNDEWQVYDVVIEKVSLVRNYRSSYSSVLRKKDMAGLLEEMQAKIDELKQRHAEEDRSA